jgi:DNA-binding MarR family transcriptional regulator
VTRVVAALEADGLVTREAGREDRRVTWVGATPRGVRVLEEGRLRRVEALARELAALEGRDQDTLARAIDLLERIVGPRHRPVRREE